MNNCIIRLKIKLTGGPEDIPESIMGMINLSLSILNEQDKKACYLNRKKSLKPLTFPRTLLTFMTIREYGTNVLRPLQITSPLTSHGCSQHCLTSGASGILLCS
jgi:hypothetical protein